MTDAIDRWFVAEILPHEEVLVGYLRRSWPRRDEIDDLRQETYVRVYEAATKALPQAPKSFLFTIARNLMVDRVRRSRIVSIEAVGGLGELEGLNVLVEEPSSENRVGARQDLRRLAAAFDRLPPRCREVLWLRRVAEFSQKEVAARLGIGEKAVEKSLARGVHLLTADFFGGGLDSDTGTADCSDRKDRERETTHGKRQSD